MWRVSIRARFNRSGRLWSRRRLLCLRCFNPRPLQSKRATRSNKPGAWSSRFQSAPASIEAGDRQGLADRERVSRFNPRPLQSKRATLKTDGDSIDERRFNPRPLQSKRATVAVGWLKACWQVSIRARFNRSGRRRVRLRDSDSRRFQSAPASIEAGDASVRSVRANVVFQSAPASIEAGDAQPWRFIRFQRVSIRARFNRSGRRWMMPRPHSHISFQSAPASIEAGDVRAPRPGCQPPCFNPRPLQSKRATFQQGRSRHPNPRFNPRPLQSKRATDTSVPNFVIPMFQSAPASIEAGDAKLFASTNICACFNPRPLQSKRATRRAHSQDSRPSCFNPRPLQSKRATIDAPVLAYSATFQSAPASIEAGDNRPARRLLDVHRFNPRPLQSKRATNVQSPGLVLILFQSAPASIEAGDLLLRKRTRHEHRFNPRPLQSKRATAGNRRFKTVYIVSIRARFNRSGRPVTIRAGFVGPYVSIRARFNRSGRRAVPGAR